uniref:Uncharacterized protein n=1 Tax=Arundo donax TaxID=35708 RepID=A0A0A9CGS0_ARUDO
MIVSTPFSDPRNQVY